MGKQDIADFLRKVSEEEINEKLRWIKLSCIHRKHRGLSPGDKSGTGGPVGGRPASERPDDQFPQPGCIRTAQDALRGMQQSMAAAWAMPVRAMC